MQLCLVLFTDTSDDRFQYYIRNYAGKGCAQPRMQSTVQDVFWKCKMITAYVSGMKHRLHVLSCEEPHHCLNLKQLSGTESPCDHF